MFRMKLPLILCVSLWKKISGIPVHKEEVRFSELSNQALPSGAVREVSFGKPAKQVEW
jgi:hypothetical protein